MSQRRDSMLTLKARVDALRARATARAWSWLQPREQRALALGAAVLAAAIAWKAVLLPAQAYLHQAQQAYEQNKVALVSLARIRHGMAVPAPRSTASLSAVLTETAQAAGVGINTLTVQSDTKVELQSAPVAFSVALGWLAALETREHLIIDDLQIRKVAEGIVRLRLVVTRRHAGSV